MSPLEQHTAIALALGYTFEDKVIIYDGSEIKFRLWKTPNGGGMARDWPPNYPEDLNAMHEAVESLRCRPGPEWFDFQKHLMDECGSTMNCINATAAQRAEAFLKTLNLWTPPQ